MIKIQTIASPSHGDFDSKVNQMIIDGWKLIESSIRTAVIQRNIHSVKEVMHYGTLKKEVSVDGYMDAIHKP